MHCSGEGTFEHSGVRDTGTQWLLLDTAVVLVRCSWTLGRPVSGVRRPDGVERRRSYPGSQPPLSGIIRGGEGSGGLGHLQSALRAPCLLQLSWIFKIISGTRLGLHSSSCTSILLWSTCIHSHGCHTIIYHLKHQLVSQPRQSFHTNLLWRSGQLTQETGGSQETGRSQDGFRRVSGGSQEGFRRVSRVRRV